MTRRFNKRGWAVVATAAMTAATGVALASSASASVHRASMHGAAVHRAPVKGTPTSVTVVAQGLNNPRGLTWSNGHLYVAEAGTGGSDCPAGTKGPTGGQLCAGLSGSVVQLLNGAQRTVLSGLISLSDLPGGLAAIGVSNVAATQSGLKVLFGDSVVGLLASVPKGVSFAPQTSAAIRAELGRLANVVGGHLRVVRDVGDSDYSWTAVHQNLVPKQFPDANPNALVLANGTTYVVDAASNTLDSVNKAGTVKQLEFIPNAGRSDAVPTCVAWGPDRALYIGQLAPGVPKNGAKIYRFDPRTGRLSVWKTGFNVVDGCGFDRAGNFYAVEFQANGFNPGPTGNPAGDIVKIAPNGARSVLGAGQLFFPQGFATDGHGNIYVSNWSILTGRAAHPGMPTGEVVRLKG